MVWILSDIADDVSEDLRLAEARLAHLERELRFLRTTFEFEEAVDPYVTRVAQQLADTQLHCEALRALYSRYA